MKRSVLRFYPLLFGVWVVCLSADEVTDHLTEASGFYNSKQYSEAVQQLQKTIGLIRHRYLEDLAGYLPETPDEWSATEVVFNTDLSGRFDGGNSVSRQYAKGDATVVVSLMVDAPLLSSMLMFINHPAFLESSGKKVERYSGQKAISEWKDEGSGTISVVVAGEVLVSIKAENTSVETLRWFANAIDYRKLAKDLSR